MDCKLAESQDLKLSHIAIVTIKFISLSSDELNCSQLRSMLYYVKCQPASILYNK